MSLKRYRHNTAEKRNSYYDASLDEISECVAADGDVDERITAQDKRKTETVSCKGELA